MAAPRISVTYLDGRQVDVVATARAQVDTERHYSGYSIEQNVEFSYYLAWATLHKAGDVTLDFEAWLDTVADCDESPEPVNPTPETQTPTASSD